MSFDFNAYNAARPGTRPAPGTPGFISSSKSGFDYNAYNAARPGTSIGNCLANYSLTRGYNSSSSYNSSSKYNSNIRITGNPYYNAKNFAKRMGVSIAKAKQVLQGLFGRPVIR